jgi:aspartyl-tRNA(Asn)/glutamyl-tRNA(Gln) amidotransferase subunit B
VSTATSRQQIEARLIVGLEIHVELATCSKMFTAAANIAHPDHDQAAPNALLDPVVIGMPGTLPVINRTAVEMAILVGLALGCRIASVTKWDRKSYCYPDLPKNYQISQYDQPLCLDGCIDVPVSDTPGAAVEPIRIIRAHLEEDAGKLLHEAPGGMPIDYSIVDLNRAGTPLLEIVTEPDFQTADQVVAFGQALRQICRTLGVSGAVMEKGHMRFEPNINVAIEHGGETFHTPIVEIKNLNSFKALRGAIDYEYDRQIDAWIETGRVMGQRAKSTRGWDDQKMCTVLQRQKEDADEYRYFPDPDLVPVVISDEWLSQIKTNLPELPLHRQQRYIDELGLNHADTVALMDEPSVSTFFDAILALDADPQRTAAMLLNHGAKRANEQHCRIDEVGINAEQVKQILDLTAADKISSNAAAELFVRCCTSDDTAVAIAKQHQMLQVSDSGALEAFVDEVLAEAKNQKLVNDIRAGKDKAIGALIGKVMKLSRGQANPKMVTDLIKQKLQG